MAGQKIPKGTILFRAGDPCPGFVVLSAGSICVSLTSANGKEIVLYRVQPGEVCLQTFACLIEGRNYSAEGVAETDLAAEILPPVEFHRRLASDEAFRSRVFSAIAHRFADFEQLVEDVALTGLQARLARVLLRLADGAHNLSVTHDRLAAEAGSGRAVVTRQLGEFARNGLISLSRGRISLLNPTALERLSHEE